MVNKVFDIMMGSLLIGDKPDAGTQPLLISLVCVGLVISIMCKVILDRYDPVLFYCFSVFFSYILGRIYSRYYRSEFEIFQPSTILSPLQLKLLLPVSLYATSLRLTNIKFLGFQELGRISSLFVVVFISYFLILFGIVTGLFGLCFDWKVRSQIVLCVCLSLFQSELIIDKLEGKGGDVQYLQSLFKGEVLMDMLIAFTISDIIYKISSPVFYPREYSISGTVVLVLIQLLGVLIGFVYAFFSPLLYNFVSSNSSVTSLISFPLVFIVYSSSELAGASGCAAVSTFGIITSVFIKPRLSENDEKFIWALWDIVYFITSISLSSSVGFIIGAADREYDIRMFCYAVGLFITTIVMRAFYCFVAFPYIYTKGQIKWKEVGLAVIGPYRGIHSVLIAVRFATENTDESHQLLILIVVIVYISIFMNIVLLDWFLQRLDVFHLSNPQISNMNLAVEQINKCRANMMFAEKLDRIVADANWSVVTAVTDFPHPYKDQIESGMSLEVFKEDFKAVECPKCGAWSIAPPTKKESEEITREVKLSFLKAQEVSYVKQRETGTLSNQGYKFLSNIIYQASNSETASVNTDDLKIATEDMKFVRGLESFIRKIREKTMESYEWVPTNKFRLNCYHITISQTFKIVMAVSSLVDMFLTLFLLYLYVKNTIQSDGGSWPILLLYYGRFVSYTFPIFYFSNVFEVFVQLCGLGLVQYFSKRAYMIEFFSCIVTRAVQLGMFFYQCSLYGRYMNLVECDGITMYLCLLMCFRVSRVYIFIVSVIPTILRRIERLNNRNLMKKYDIGKAYLVGLDRALKYSGQLTNNEGILEDIRKEVEGNRQKVSKEMGLIQKEYPTIAITVKTKHAIRHVINSMGACVTGLLDEGILDYIEHNALRKPIEKLKVKLRELDEIVPPSPMNIMREISWLVGDEESTGILLEEVQMSNYDYNDVLIRNGDDPVGLYILVSGLLKATYVPSSTSIQLAAKFGVLPNHDFFENFKFDQPQEDYIVSGNVIGELGAVSGRRYDMTVTAETAVQVFFVPWETIKLFHETNSGQRLLERIWKKIAQKISMTLLQFTGAYRHWTRERLMGFLQKGLLPDLSGVIALRIDHRIEEVILVEGVAMDVSNRTIIYGPYRIPKTVTRLWLPEHRSWDFQTVYPTRIYLVLSSGASVSDLLETEYSLDDDRFSSEGGSDFWKKKATSRKVGFFQEENDADY